jgi:DNA-binding YbaB/EbfC family protein
LGAKLKALEAVRPLSELLPWMLSLTDGVLINKDGSLMSCYAFQGMDTRGRPDSEPEAGADAVRRALDTSGSGRLMLWWTVERTRMHGYPKGAFMNPVAGRLDGEYRQACERERWYVNRRYLSVVQSPESALAGALKRAAREGMAAGAGGLIRWAREKWSGEGRFETDVADLLGRLTEYREMAALEITGQSGGGLVSVVMTGRHDVRRVTIDPSLLGDDKDMLEDLVAAAVNDAVQKVEKTVQERFSGLAAGAGLPPGMKLPF